MDYLLQWVKAIRRASHRRWNKPLKFRRDVSAIEYSKRKGVDFVYVDIETGEIMQFGGKKNRGRHIEQWDGMFPTRNMKPMSLNEYEELTRGKEPIL